VARGTADAHSIDTQGSSASFTKKGSYSVVRGASDIKEGSMSVSLQTNVQMIKGVGPQRAEVLAERGIHTLEDLLYHLPFRYEDRIHFSKIKEVQPYGVYWCRTIPARCPANSFTVAIWRAA
jgi:hypothetical protein